MKNFETWCKENSSGLYDFLTGYEILASGEASEEQIDSLYSSLQKKLNLEQVDTRLEKAIAIDAVAHDIHQGTLDAGEVFELGSDIAYNILTPFLDELSGEYATQDIRKTSRGYFTTLLGEDIIWLSKSPDPMIIGGYACLDDQTKLVTKRGVIDYRDIKVGDVCFSIDPTTKELKESRVKKRFVYPYDGEMLFAEKSKLGPSMVVTPNHHVLRATNNDEFVYQRADECFNFEGPLTFPVRCSSWSGIPLDLKASDFVDQSQFRKNTRYYLPEKIPTEPFLRLAAWYVTEGGKNSSTGINIWQKDEDNIADIMNAAQMLSLNPVRRPSATSGTTTIRIQSKALAVILQGEFGVGSHNKKIPTWLKSASTDELRIFFDTCVKGDGYNRKNKWAVSLYTVSEHLRDDYAEIGVKLGYAVRTSIVKTNYANSFHSRTGTIFGLNFTHRNGRVPAEKRTRVPYKGTVWAIQTNSEPNFLAVRGRDYFFTGNSVEGIDKEGHLIPNEVLQEAFDNFMKNAKMRNLIIAHSDVQIGEVIPRYTSPTTGKEYVSGVDKKGLFIVAKLRDDLKVARRVQDEIKNGNLRSFSIAGNAGSKTLMTKSGKEYYEIGGLELAEISVCERPVNQDAHFKILKSSPSEKVEEKLLRSDGESFFDGALVWWTDRCDENMKSLPPLKGKIVSHTDSGAEVKLETGEAKRFDFDSITLPGSDHHKNAIKRFREEGIETPSDFEDLLEEKAKSERADIEPPFEGAVYDDAQDKWVKPEDKYVGKQAGTKPKRVKGAPRRFRTPKFRPRTSPFVKEGDAPELNAFIDFLNKGGTGSGRKPSFGEKLRGKLGSLATEAAIRLKPPTSAEVERGHERLKELYRRKTTKSLDDFLEKKVVKRGDKFLVVECHGGRTKTLGTHDTREKAESQHRAIMASKYSKSGDNMPILNAVEDFTDFLEKEKVEDPYAVATSTAREMGFKDFSPGSKGAKKRDEIADALSKGESIMDKLNQLEKGGPGSGRKKLMKLPTPKPPTGRAPLVPIKALDDLTDFVEKQGPGPPPRPGLVWDPQAHRWKKVSVATEDKKSFSNLLRTQRTKGPEAYKELSRSELRSAQKGAVHAYHTSTDKREKQVAFTTMQRLNTALRGKEVTKSLDDFTNFLDKGGPGSGKKKGSGVKKPIGALGFRRPGFFTPTKIKKAETAYCLKCKKKVEIKNPKETKVGDTKGIKGECPSCGTKIFKIKG